MKIINNQDVVLLDEIKSNVTKHSKIYLSCDHFTAYAFYKLKDVFEIVTKVNVLLNYNFSDTEDDFRFIQSQYEKSLNLSLDRKFIVSKVGESIMAHIEIRSGSIGNQNILIIRNLNHSVCYFLTPLNLDSVSLGAVNNSSPIFINAIVDEKNQYLNLFKHAWSQSKLLLNDQVLLKLEKATKPYSAESIYKYCIRHIFEYSTIDERLDEKLRKVGFKDAKVWSLLYNFQKDAVIGAIEKIETYGGCIIADSVGLGKTFEALAVMKYYLLRNDRILVIAPKKLRENWTVYQLNDKRNILAEDRLNYDVLNHTDLSKIKRNILSNLSLLCSFSHLFA